jgi:hypothetical protein
LILPTRHVGEEILQGRAVEGGPREAAVIIALRSYARSICGYRLRSAGVLERPASWSAFPVAKGRHYSSGFAARTLRGDGLTFYLPGKMLPVGHSR